MKTDITNMALEEVVLAELLELAFVVLLVLEAALPEVEVTVVLRAIVELAVCKVVNKNPGDTGPP